MDNGRGVLLYGPGDGWTMLYCVDESEIPKRHKSPWGWYVATNRYDDEGRRIFEHEATQELQRKGSA